MPRPSPNASMRLSASLAWSLLWGLSGFSLLTLETVWLRAIALRAGNTAVASTLVVAVFFVCAALGNLLGARLVTGNHRPLRWYARFEILASLAAAAGWLLWQPAGQRSAWAGALLLAGPASFCSGVAFPSLAQAFVSRTSERTARGGFFYGIHLLGSALGVAAGGVWLPWHLGTHGSFAVAVAAQLAGGAMAWRAVALEKPGPGQPSRGRESGQPAAPPSVLPRAAGWCLLAASGFLSLGAQTLLIVWARQVLEGSIYVVCSVLAGFLAGLGWGALAAAALRRRGRTPLGLLPWFAGSGAFLLFLAPAAAGWCCLQDVALVSRTPALLLLEALLRCGLPLLPVAFCLGGVFPLAWELAHPGAASQGRALGAAMALNKAAAAAGAAAALFMLMPVAGLDRGTLWVAWGYAGMALLPLLLGSSQTRRAWPAMALLLATGVFQSSQPGRVLGLTPELKLIAAETGAYGPVAVVEERVSGSRHILLNTRQRLSGTGQALSSQRHQSWVPLLLCRQPDKVTSIGMASGISAAAALDFPVKELLSVELVPEVVRAAERHFGDWNTPLFTDPRSRVCAGDGRRALARSEPQDAILCDLFFPAEEGSALLYSREFFALGLARLRPGGVFCLWLPCHQHSPGTAGMIVRTFQEVFPCAVMVRAGLDPLEPVVGLLGSREPLPFSQEFLAQQLATPWGQRLASRSPFFQSPGQTQMLLVCDLHAAEPAFDGHPAITDDRPLLAWLGPRKPGSKDRLHGFPFLEWTGKRALSGRFPSCDLGQTSPAALLDSVRAGNYLYAASAAAISLPGDPRPEAVRREQVRTYLERARQLHPTLDLNPY